MAACLSLPNAFMRRRGSLWSWYDTERQRQLCCSYRAEERQTLYTAQNSRRYNQNLLLLNRHTAPNLLSVPRFVLQNT
jgi:hypothetical protein